MSTIKTTNIAHPSSASNNIVLDSSARVLVGTSASETINGDQVKVQIKSTDANAGLSIHRSQNTLDSPWLNFVLSRAGSIVQNNDQLGTITFLGDDGTDLNSAAALIRCQVDGTPGANDMPGRLIFSTTADGASSPTERLRITNDGYTFFGCTAQPSSSVAGFSVSPNIATVSTHRSSTGSITTLTSHFAFINGNGTVGTIQTNGSSTSFNTSSDYRLKENVEPVTEGINRLQQLKPCRFNFIADPDKTVDGFIAHEVQEVVPEAIAGEKDAVDDDGNPVYQGIDQSKLVPLLTAALQEAVAKIESLETRLTAAGI